MNSANLLMVPFISLNRESRDLVQAQLSAVKEVLCSGQWILGEKVKEFENCWARYTNSVGAVGVGNGLDALEIALRTLGIGKGDEVVTTSMTAFATALAIQRCGAIPVFADINPSTACIDGESITRCLTEKTRAILVVHLYGRASNMSMIQTICKANKLFLVEDCAQAHGCYFEEKPLGSCSDIAAWSFYPTKNLGAVGDAGALTSNNLELIELARTLRSYGQSDRYHHVISGLNSRMDEVQAAILLTRLKFLDEWNNTRRHLASRYWSGISNPRFSFLSKPESPQEHVHHQFVIRCNERQRLQEYLFKNGISTIIHYPIPCHEQPAMSDYRCDPLGLQNTNMHAATCLSLPLHPFLKEVEQEYILAACNKFE